MDKPGDATLSKEASNVERFGLKDGSSCLTREWEYAIDDGEHEEEIGCFAAPIGEIGVSFKCAVGDGKDLHGPRDKKQRSKGGDYIALEMLA